MFTTENTRLRTLLRVLTGVVLLALLLGSCNLFGPRTTVSVAFADSRLRGAGNSTAAASAAPRSATYGYNTTQIGSVDVAGVQAAYEAVGTYLGSYTPDVFMITGLSLAFARSDSNEGLTVLAGDGGSADDPVYFDLLNPVYVSESIRWQPGTYDLAQLCIPMDVPQDDLLNDSIPPGNDIQIVVPGYTDEEIYAWQSEVSEAHAPLAGTDDDIVLIPYLGDNRFQLPRLMSTARLMVGEYTDEFGGQMSVTFPTESMMFRRNITQSTVYSDMAGSVTEESFFQGNTYLKGDPWGVWADIPFDGLVIDEETTELRVTFYVDMQDLFQLWEMTDEYLANGGGGLSAKYRIRFAPDFYERITVEVEQAR